MFLLTVTFRTRDVSPLLLTFRTLEEAVSNAINFQTYTIHECELIQSR